MLNRTLKNELSSVLNEAIMQLIQAQKYLNQDELIKSGVYLGTVQDVLPKVHLKILIASGASKH